MPFLFLSSLGVEGQRAKRLGQHLCTIDAPRQAHSRTKVAITHFCSVTSDPEAWGAALEPEEAEVEAAM